MASVWNTALQLPDGMFLYDLQLKGDTPFPHTNATLTFLSLVENAKVPPGFKTGADYAVSTLSPESKLWFSGHLFRAPGAPANGPGGASRDIFDGDRQSYAGVLANVATTHGPRGREYVAQILFRGVLDDAVMRVRAWYISGEQLALTQTSKASDIPHSSEQHRAIGASALANGQVGDVALSVSSPGAIARPPSSDILNNPVADLFDKAQESRRRNNGRGGAAVSAAAAGMMIGSVKNGKRPASDAESIPLKSPRLPGQTSVSGCRCNGCGTCHSFDPPHQTREQRSSESIDMSDVSSPTANGRRRENEKLLARWVDDCLQSLDYYKPGTRPVEQEPMDEESETKSRPDGQLFPDPKAVGMSDKAFRDARDAQFEELSKHVYIAAAFSVERYMADAQLQDHSRVVRQIINKLVTVFIQVKWDLDNQTGFVEEHTVDDRLETRGTD